METARSAVPVIEPGDTNVSILVTGGTAPLISRVTSIPVDTNAPGGVVEFDVGFATQEFSIGNVLVDSLTVTLLDRSEQAGAVLFVVDVNGAVWMPSVPGAVALPSGYLEAADIELPEIRMGLPGLNTQFAYHLSVRLPAALWGPAVKLALDVFDYPNGLASIAWNGPATFVSDVIPPCAPPPLGLAAWWKAEGNALDSVGPHSGAIHGDVTFVNGRSGMAFGFDGTDSAYVSVPARAELSPQAGLYLPAQDFGGEISIEAWIRMPTLPSVNEGRRVILSKAGEYELAVQSSGAVIFSIGEVASAVGGSVTAGAWHHVAATFRQGMFVRAYVDGQRVGENAQSPAVANAGSAPLWVGRSSSASAGSYFRGEVDELAIYHHALTDGDVAALHAAGVSGKCMAPLILRFDRLSETLRLRWLRAVGGVVLEQSEALGAAAVWVPSPVFPTVTGEDVIAEVPLQDAAKFYRLRR